MNTKMKQEKSPKKKKRKYEQSTKIIDLAWLPYAKYFLYKMES